MMVGIRAETLKLIKIFRMKEELLLRHCSLMIWMIDLVIFKKIVSMIVGLSRIRSPCLKERG